MNSQILQQGTNHKHLGLFFSNNGLWHDHIDYIVKKAYTRIKERQVDWMRLDSALKKSRPQYISAQIISTLFDEIAR